MTPILFLPQIFVKMGEGADLRVVSEVFFIFRNKNLAGVSQSKDSENGPACPFSE